MRLLVVPVPLGGGRQQAGKLSRGAQHALAFLSLAYY
jgi:hypothetical protein